MTLPKRKSPRLRNWDYSSGGVYFITICTHNKEPLFGCIPPQVAGAIHESPLQNGRTEISKAVGYLKMNVSKSIHQTHPDQVVWQRSFHDHIIRDEADYIRIWNYIDTNPTKWTEDCFYLSK